MAEKLFPLDFPPGLHNTGTPYQSKGRWHAGNLVRFYQGTIQPVGGWVARTLTGATISGTPNAAISWTTNDGISYLAIGTSTHLYVVSSANVVSDITPTTIVSPQPYLWQLETFGSYLIAMASVTPVQGVGDGAAPSFFQWTGAVATPATIVGDWFTAPHRTWSVTVTPERFLVALRGEDPVSAPFRAAPGGGPVVN